MKKILISVIISILMVLTISNFTSVNASSFVCSPTSSKKNVKPGEEITITLSVSNIDLGDKGMQVLEGVLKYDDEVFEPVKKTDISGQSNWVVEYNDENTDLHGKFLFMTLGEGIKEDKEFATIKLKVKEDAEPQTTTVTLSNIAANDGTNLVEEGTKNIPIVIESINDSSNDGSNDNSGSNVNDEGNKDSNQGTQAGNENKGTQTINGSNTAKNNNSNKNNTIANKLLPKTGTDKKHIVIFIGVLMIAIFGIISYKKYKKIILK